MRKPRNSSSWLWIITTLMTRKRCETEALLAPYFSKTRFFSKLKFWSSRFFAGAVFVSGNSIPSRPRSSRFAPRWDTSQAQKRYEPHNSSTLDAVNDRGSPFRYLIRKYFLLRNKITIILTVYWAYLFLLLRLIEVIREKQIKVKL